MLFRDLDANGDWRFGAGLSNLASQNDAIALNIRTRVLSWMGDCFFDMKAGIDWVNRLGSKNQATLLDLDLRRIILETEGVTGLVQFDIVYQNRIFTANYTVNTIYGQEYADIVNMEI